MSGTSRLILTLGIGLLLCINCVIMISYHSRAQISVEKPVTYSYIGDDYPSSMDIPGINGPVEMSFAETEAYPLTGQRAYALWTSIRAPTSHLGYVRLGPEHRYFALSMFHQLHCVNQLRLNIFEPNNPKASEGHVQHCLTYLRQFFLCAADDTLEPGDFTTKNYSVERSSHTRVCRNWSAAFDEAEANYEQWLSFSNDKAKT